MSCRKTVLITKIIKQSKFGVNLEDKLIYYLIKYYIKYKEILNFLQNNLALTFNSM